MGSRSNAEVEDALKPKIKAPKLKPHVPEKIVDPIKTAPPGGEGTPGAKKKRSKSKK